MSKMQAALQAKNERDRAAACAKRHNELVKQAEKMVKKKGASRESALQLFEAAYKEQHVATTLLRVAELQYEVGRLADAASSADRVIRSQPSPNHLAAAQAIVKRTGMEPRNDWRPAGNITGHLDAVLHGSTGVAPTPTDPWAAAPAASRVGTDPWAAQVQPTTTHSARSADPATGRGRGADAISQADALFGRPAAAPAAPPPAAAGAGNPFAMAEPADEPAARPCTLASAATPFTLAAGLEEASSDAATDVVSSGEEEEERSSALVLVLSGDDLLAAALEALSSIAARVEELAAAGTEAEPELRSLTRRLARLHD